MDQIVFLDSGTTSIGDVSFGDIALLGNWRAFDYSSKKEGIDRGKDATIVIVNKFKVTKEVLSHWKRCQLICVAATGYNNVDINACQDLGITVCNVRGYSTKSVAQYVWATLLSLTNHSSYYFEEVRKGRWHQTKDFTFYDHSFESLAEMTMGIIGMGTIGQEVARLALAFGMETLAVAKYESKIITGVKGVRLDQILQKCDVLSIHVPLTNQTKNMINLSALQMMKPTAILINTARGPIVETSALIDHCAAQPRFRAILDVLEFEPPQQESRLFEMPNVFITPHIAWASKEAREGLVRGICKNIKGYQEGKPINEVT